MTIAEEIEAVKAIKKAAEDLVAVKKQARRHIRAHRNKIRFWQGRIEDAANEVHDLVSRFREDQK